MYNLLLWLIEVLKPTQNLGDDQFGLFLWHLLVLLKIEVEIGSRAKLQHSAKAVMIDLNRVELLHHSSVVQVLMDLILSKGMLDVTFFDLLTPAIVEVMDLASHLSAALEIISSVDFGVAALPQKTQEQVLPCKHTVALLGW